MPFDLQNFLLCYPLWVIMHDKRKGEQFGKPGPMGKNGCGVVSLPVEESQILPIFTDQDLADRFRAIMRDSNIPNAGQLRSGSLANKESAIHVLNEMIKNGIGLGVIDPGGLISIANAFPLRSLVEKIEEEGKEI